MFLKDSKNYMKLIYIKYDSITNVYKINILIGKII